MPDDALEDDPPNRARRMAGVSESDYGDEEARMASRTKPDFANLRGLTGEDEMFAVKRAQSRVWEMCSRKWWAKSAASAANNGHGDGAGDVASQGWWRPLPLASRHWERSAASVADSVAHLPAQTPGRRSSMPPNTTIPPSPAQQTEIRISASHMPVDREKPVRPATQSPPQPGVPKDNEVFTADEVESLFPHGASPFRSTADPPPRFGAEHAWGVTTWGRKAGAWGSGVEGLGERRGSAAAGVEVRGGEMERKLDGQTGRKGDEQTGRKLDNEAKDDIAEEQGKSAGEAESAAKTSTGEGVPWTPS